MLLSIPSNSKEKLEGIHQNTSNLKGKIQAGEGKVIYTDQGPKGVYVCMYVGICVCVCLRVSVLWILEGNRSTKER